MKMGMGNHVCTIQECNTDKNRPVSRASKSAHSVHNAPRQRDLPLMLSSSTSNLRVALGGMTGGNPRAPYACWGTIQVSLYAASYEVELLTYIIRGGSQRSPLTERQLGNACIHETHGVRAGCRDMY